MLAGRARSSDRKVQWVAIFLVPFFDLKFVYAACAARTSNRQHEYDGLTFASRFPRDFVAYVRSKTGNQYARVAWF